MAEHDGWPSGKPGGERQPGAVASLSYDAESMVEFKKRVDQLVIELGDSPAAPKQVGTAYTKRNHFGGGEGAWAEAAGLNASYELVVERLKELSQLMSDCLEGMGIAVVSAKSGYADVDDDIRRRMLVIQAHTQQHYDADRDPTAERRPPADGAPAAELGDTAGAGGLK